MKTLLIIASTIIVLVSSTAFAHSKFHGHHSSPLGKIEHILKKLDVTEEQREQIAPIVENTQTELKPVLEQTRETREIIQNLIRSDKLDKAALSQAAQMKSDLMVQKIELMASAKEQISSILTEEQRQKFQAMKEKRQSKRHKRCERKGKWLDSY